MYNLPVEYGNLDQKERRLVREQYVKEQNGLCWFCKKHLFIEPDKTKKINLKMFPEGFLDHPIHLQHDHYTGLTEGAVHAYCNAVMWQYHGK
jgi:hypothetical protein